MGRRSAGSATAALAIVAGIGLGSAPAQGQELDRDGDGVLDAEDACPTLAATNVHGGEGCPPDPAPNAAVRAAEAARPGTRETPRWIPAISGESGDDYDPPGPAMRNVGIALTVSSLVVGAVGAAIGGHLSGQGHDERITGALVGIGTGVLGGSMLVTGVTLWVVGAARYDGPSTSASTRDRSAYGRVGSGYVASASVRGAF